MQKPRWYFSCVDQPASQYRRKLNLGARIAHYMRCLDLIPFHFCQSIKSLGICKNVFQLIPLPSFIYHYIRQPVVGAHIEQPSSGWRHPFPDRHRVPVRHSGENQIAFSSYLIDFLDGNHLIVIKLVQMRICLNNGGAPAWFSEVRYWTRACGWFDKIRSSSAPVYPIAPKMLYFTSSTPFTFDYYTPLLYFFATPFCVLYYIFWPGNHFLIANIAQQNNGSAFSPPTPNFLLKSAARQKN